MSAYPSATSTLHVSAAQPATYDAAGYNALAWTEVGEITDIPEFGREYSQIKHVPLKTRAAQKFKGSFDEGAIQVAYAKDTDDAGQVIMAAAVLSDNDYSFKITTKQGDKFCFQAKVMSHKTNIGNADSITAGSSSLDISATTAGVGIVPILA
jgi:hypothetical protein